MEDEVIKVLNEMIKNCEPITYEEFNVFIPAKDGGLVEAEEKDDRIGVAVQKLGAGEQVGISTLSLIATLTDVMCKKRLAFTIEDETNVITGVCWS